MKIKKQLLICMCCLMIASTVWGQAANSSAKSGVLGYLDPRTGAFRPVPAAVDDGVDPAALTTFTGTITVAFTITVKTTTLANITCTADVSVLDSATTGGRFISETGTAAATGTGPTRNCKVTIPYSWALATQASDNMTTTYGVFGASATTTNGFPQRTSTLSPLDTRKVPASGATTALTAAVTL